MLFLFSNTIIAAFVRRLILHDIDHLCDTAKLASKSLGGIIHLGVPPSFGPYLLPFIIPRLHKDFPDLKLHITEAPPRELEIGLDQGKYDLLLSSTPALMAELNCMTLIEEPLMVGLSPENKLAEKDTLVGEDLSGQKVMTLGVGHQLYEQAQSISTQYGCQIMSEYEGTSLDALKHMVVMNMGISFFPALYAISDIEKDDDIIALPFKGGTIKRSLGLIWRRTSPRIKDFHVIADIIKSAVKERFDDVVIVK
ncbi:LysR substrate-binding domain-containing protein [Pseudemcibacter aquimaris]|uniref:LysR substrate-binding domain-containing protein n=1 Tax=Pseudemcibacter aquimaris TaxID=2857064 RepID=UPI002011BD2C|nr:LysR substrate-binding domain-containing protein [Pseudemcibacter aquimaris]MCC3861041.1 hypothetical protein [Pseudemcibacter aquimaris]WDU59858.1 hypothetical protein KW060_06265 [Pseudemcibacter aquimaris]